MIHARGLVQTFKTGRGKNKSEVHAVSGVDLDIEEGEVVGFLGPNGAGKTTTLRMLVTLLKPTAGSATVAGYDVVTEPEEVRRSIGYVSQAGSTFSGAFAGDEVVDHGMLYGMSKAQATAAGRGAVRPARARGSVAADAQEHVRRPEAPAGRGHGAYPRADPGLPRRTDHRSRPAGPGQPLGAHRGPAPPSWRDRVPHDALPRRGRRPQRPDPHHRQGPDRRQRHPRQPEGAGLRRPGRPRGRRPGPGERRRRATRRDRRRSRGRRPSRPWAGRARRPRRTRPAAGARRLRRHPRLDRGPPANPGRRLPDPDRSLSARRRGQQRGRRRRVGASRPTRHPKEPTHDLHARMFDRVSAPDPDEPAEPGLGADRCHAAGALPPALRAAAQAAGRSVRGRRTPTRSWSRAC